MQSQRSSKATYSIGPIDLFASVKKIVGGSDGLLAEAGVSATQPLSDKFFLGAKASATFADDNYMQSYFGVDKGQSGRSGYAEYKAGAGIKSVDLTATATYLIDKHWTVRAEQKVGFLVGDAADSPITKEKVQSRSMLMVGYRF